MVLQPPAFISITAARAPLLAFVSDGTVLTPRWIHLQGCCVCSSTDREAAEPWQAQKNWVNLGRPRPSAAFSAGRVGPQAQQLDPSPHRRAPATVRSIPTVTDGQRHVGGHPLSLLESACSAACYAVPASTAGDPTWCPARQIGATRGFRCASFLTG